MTIHQPHAELAKMLAPIANIFDDIGGALRRGVNPRTVALACELAANSLRSPDRLTEITEAAQNAVRKIQASRTKTRQPKEHP